MSWIDPLLPPILDYGYTDKEARFLVTVAVHSGHFFRSQYSRFRNVVDGQIASNFISKALGKGHIREYEYPPNARRYHLHNKGFYSRIGFPNSQLRRQKSLSFIHIRLACLDFVLEHTNLEYLPDSSAKYDFFSSLGIPDNVFPTRAYLAKCDNDDSISRAYFPDRFPISRDPLVFTYVDEQTTTISSFETYLGSYRSLLLSLRRPFSFFYCSPVTSRMASAERVWSNFISSSRESSLDPNIERYFGLKEKYLRKAWSELSKQDLLDRVELSNQYEQPQFLSLYDQWRSGIVPQSSSNPVSINASFSCYYPTSFK